LERQRFEAQFRPLFSKTRQSTQWVKS
jgi:hypothetical protein